mgnify:FL=1
MTRLEKANIDCPDCGWMCLIDMDNSDAGVFCQNPKCMIGDNFKRVEPNEFNRK